MTRELLQRALDALESDPVPLNAINNASALLRTALAAPMPEPVIGTKTWFEDGKLISQNLTASDVYAAPPAAPAPGGMVMVPREPTPEMARAGWALLPSGLKDPWDYGIVKARQVYRAMIAATPPAAPAPVVREPLTDERAAFEAWVLQGGTHPCAIVRDDIGYVVSVTAACWEAWQARAHGIGGGGNG